MSLQKTTIVVSVALLIFFSATNTVFAQQQKIKAVTVIASMLLLDDQTKSKKLAISWQRPIMRENNASLNASEIDYYRLRYRLIGASTYSTKIIYMPYTSINLTLSGEPSSQYELAIQAIDINGFASRYTDNVFVAFADTN